MIAHFPTTLASASTSQLIILDLSVEGVDRKLRALLDTGASNNFVRAKSLEDSSIEIPSADSSASELIVRLADGTSLSVPQRTLTLNYSLNDLAGKDNFLLLDLDERYDLILGLPWCSKHQPIIDWNRSSVSFPSNPLEVTFAPLQTESSLSEHSLRPVCDGPALNDSNDVSISKSNRFSCLNSSSSPDGDDEVTDTPLPVRYHRSILFASTKKSPRMRARRKKVFSPGPGKSLSKMPLRQKSFTTLNSIYINGEDAFKHSVTVENPPTTAAALTAYPVMEYDEFVHAYDKGDITQVCVLLADDLPAPSIMETLATSSQMDLDVLDDKTRMERYESQTWESLKSNPVFDILKHYEDVFPEEVPSELPVDRGIRHEIDLEPGTKYCVTRQWPLPKDQVEAIDKFFENRRKAGHVRESNSPHCSPTFCVKKATGGWRIVHAFNKLNDATIPAQTPIPRKDMIVDSMSGSTRFSALDLMDGYYQTLVRESDIPLTAVSTPSGMLWEWLVMPQGLKNAPATFNRMVSHILRPFRDFAPSYFDDVYIHSKARDGKTDLEVHREHLRLVLEAMRANKLYANLKKCIFAASEIPVLGCFVGKNGVRPDPEKVKAVADWPVPKNVKELRQFLGLANYLHKYSKNYAFRVRPLTQLLRDEVKWIWSSERQDAFDDVKTSLQEAPVLALPNYEKPFHVVCDASKFAIGCALMQHDEEDRERVISYQSRQLKPTESRYPVHDRELLAMKYALVKFRVYLMGETKFAMYTDHASLRHAVKTPHLSQRMARWISFFAEYNFVVHYKPGKTNILADALSRRPDFDMQSPETASHAECKACSACHADANVVVRAQSPLPDEIRRAYLDDPDCKLLLAYFSDPSEKALNALPSRLISRIHRYSMENGLLYYASDPSDSLRILVPLDEDLRTRILYEFHDSPAGGHLGREKTFLAISRDFYWPHLYKWVRKYVRTCDMCQRVKPSPSTQAPLRSLPVPSDNWQSISMDFIFGYPPDKDKNTGILVFVDRFSKMVHLCAVKETINAEETARIFIDTIYRLHGCPEEIVSDRDPRFTSRFWRTIFQLLGTKLLMSTAAHPETDGQTERVNRVLEDILNSYVHSIRSWSDFLPLAEFALNNAVHASTGHTPFFMNNARHPRIPSLLSGGESTLPVGEIHDNRRSSSSNSNSLASSASLSCDFHPQKEMEFSNKRSSFMEDSPPPNEEFVATATEFKAHFDELKDINKMSSRERNHIDQFILTRQMILRFVRDSIAEAVDRQKEQADKHGRKNKEQFKINDHVLLSTANLPKHALSNTQSTKLQHRFIGPFKILKRHGDAYTLDIPKKMRLHPTFYVGRLKRYRSPNDSDQESLESSFHHQQRHSARETNQNSSDPSSQAQCQEPSSLVEDCTRAARGKQVSLPTHGNAFQNAQQDSCFQHESSDEVRRSLDEISEDENLHSHSDSGEQVVRLQPEPNDSQEVLSAPQSEPKLRRSSRRSAIKTYQKSAAPSGASRCPPRSDRAVDRQDQDLHQTSQVLQYQTAESSDSLLRDRGKNPRFSQRAGPPPLVDSHGNERWIVDTIVSHRKKSKSRKDRDYSYEYRVRWFGYPPEKDSWLPRFVLAHDIPDILEQYEQRHVHLQ
jgi:hypothetical protein